MADHVQPLMKQRLAGACFAMAVIVGPAAAGGQQPVSLSPGTFYEPSDIDVGSLELRVYNELHVAVPPTLLDPEGDLRAGPMGDGGSVPMAGMAVGRRDLRGLADKDVAGARLAATHYCKERFNTEPAQNWVIETEDTRVAILFFMGCLLDGSS